MNKKREVLIEALEQSLRPLEDAIVEQFCILYNCSEYEIEAPIDIYRLVDMVYSVVSQTTLDEVAERECPGL